MSGALHDLSQIKSSDARTIICNYVPLKYKTKYAVGLCPFHDEKTPSFYVYPNGFHCFGCGANGDIIDFVQLIENVDFLTAICKLGGTEPIDFYKAKQIRDRAQTEKFSQLREYRETYPCATLEEDWEAQQAAAKPSEIRWLKNALSEQQAEDIEWISPARWQGKAPPRREWLVENCFMPGTVAIVSGDGGIGKSLLMMQLCAAACSHRSWLGLDVRPGKAIYFACEDDTDELWRRTHSICRAYNVEMDDLAEGGLLFRSRVGQDNALIRFEYGQPIATDLYHSLFRKATHWGATYVVIDTATKTFVGNQNNEVQVDAYITLLRRLAIALQGVVILTKHPSISGRNSGTGESGNVAWNNSVRSRLYFRKRKDGQRELKTMKNNYGPDDDNFIPLRWDHGVFSRVETPAAERWND